MNASGLTTSDCLTLETHPIGPRPDRRLQVFDRSHERRTELEAFIADRFAQAYGARIDHFADRLVGVADAAGRWTAGLGYTAATADTLFIEQYLDAPVEDVLSARLGVRVERSQIVEVGNLAAVVPGCARRLIVLMTELLHRSRYTWVVFTSTRALLNSFARLGTAPFVLGPANPERLREGPARWGRYYETRPHVMAASVPLGYIDLACGRLHAHCM